MAQHRERGRDGRGRAGAFALPLPIGVRPVGFGAAGRQWEDLRQGLRAAMREEVEHRRLFPWLAVAYGCGILLGFAADGSPSPWPALAVGIGLLAGAAVARARLARQATLLALAFVFLGFAATQLRFRAVEAPVLQRTVVGPLSGFVEALDERAGGGGRIVLRLTGAERIDEAARPSRVRLTLRSLEGLSPGDHVRLGARLLPPPEAARPGGYDFARDAYFRGLGAVGSASGKVAKTDGGRPDLALRFAAATDRARNALTARIARSIGGQSGAVAAALVTGKRGLIEERTNDVLRAAGIYHVVSISGLHMVLAAGVFFMLARALMALSPRLALHWPIKKIAAVVGMLAATAYCVFSGAEVATERSLIMILVMQGAILFDRHAMSMRNLAVAALIVLSREPEALLGPSFQMSFGAVAGLIALAEALRRWRRPAEPGDPLRRAALWLGTVLLGILATTLVATIATAPFGTYHFQNLQPYSLIGNAATLPLVSFAVMPAGVLGILALPFGLDEPIWVAMGWAVHGVLGLSGWVAGFPRATLVTPAFGAGALLLLALALLLATVPGPRLKWLAALPLAAGLAGMASAPRPDVWIARDGTGAAVRRPDGRLVVLGAVSAFTVEQWLRADGDGRRAADPTLRDPSRCDALGCTAVLPDGRMVAFVADRRGLEEDCRRAAVLVTRHTRPAGCAAATIVDRTHLAAHGATTLRRDATGALRMETVRTSDRRRPWWPEPAPPRRPVPGDPAAPSPDEGGRAAPAEDDPP